MIKAKDTRHFCEIVRKRRFEISCYQLWQWKCIPQRYVAFILPYKEQQYPRIWEVRAIWWTTSFRTECVMQTNQECAKEDYLKYLFWLLHKIDLIWSAQRSCPRSIETEWEYWGILSFYQTSNLMWATLFAWAKKRNRRFILWPWLWPRCWS